MKKVIVKCLEILIGIFVSIFVFPIVSMDNTIVDSLNYVIPFEDMPYIETNKANNTKIAFFILCMVLIVLVLTYAIRIFADSKNIKILASILNMFVIFVVGIPVTTVVYMVLEQKVMFELEQFTNQDVLVRAIILCGLYAILFSVFCELLEVAYYDKLKKERKRCRLVICKAINEKEYVIDSVVVEKKTFPVCYNYMKNNKDLIKDKQFFKIIEMNWNYSKEMNSWRYYRTLELVEVDDEKLCLEMLQNEYLQNITWQG